jgi:hypothetical protein
VAIYMPMVPQIAFAGKLFFVITTCCDPMYCI